MLRVILKLLRTKAEEMLAAIRFWTRPQHSRTDLQYSCHHREHLQYQRDLFHNFIFFKKTVGVHRGCLLSPILFNLFLEKIMQESLHDHHKSISIGGRPICNLQFANDIDLMNRGSGEF